MTASKRKRLRYTLFIVGIGGVLLLGLNWFFSYRLESFLKLELRNRVALASNGFYDLSFEHLTIDFFTGNLLIENIKLKPDSMIFNKWESVDSLPVNYAEISLQSLKFEGINLIWRFNYKKLNFDLFEVISPDIKITEPYSLQQTREKKNTDAQNIYELISPYIDILTVKNINIRHLNIQYDVKNGKYPSVYALDDINFNAINFRLDKNSSASGKLLYCDQFYIGSDKHQTILSTQQIKLETGPIKLNTQDSVISVNEIYLYPNDTIALKTPMGIDHEMLDAKIKELSIKGFVFRRDQSKTHLKARTIDISSSDIKYVASKPESNNNKIQWPENDTLSWSLYDVLSPILSSVAIDRIAITDAGFKYINLKPKGIDEYTLERLNFRAEKFMVDSASTLSNTFMYSESYTLEANDISGNIVSQNFSFNVKNVFLDTKDGIFRIQDTNINPLTRNPSKNYLRGNLKKLQISGSLSDTPLDIKRIEADSPDLYFIRNEKNSVSVRDNKKEKDRESIPILEYLLSDNIEVKELSLNNAKIHYVDNTSTKKIDVKVGGLSAFASGFKLNISGAQELRYGIFDCSNFGFRFSGLKGVIYDEYILQVNKAFYSYMNGYLEINGLELIQTDRHSKLAGTILNLSLPKISVSKLYHIGDRLVAGKLYANSPKIDIRKARNSEQGKNTTKVPFEKIFSYLYIDSIEVENFLLNYVDQITGSKIEGHFDLFQLSPFVWRNRLENNIELGKILLRKPHFYTSANSRKNNNESKSENMPFSKLSVTDIDIYDLSYISHSPNTDISLELPYFKLSGFQWHTPTTDSNLNIDVLKIEQPVIQIKSYGSSKNKTSENDSDVFETLKKVAANFSVGTLSIKDANADYSTSSNKKNLVINKVNNTDLYMEALNINTHTHLLNFNDVRFATKNVELPVSNGFYTLYVDSIGLTMKEPRLYLDNLRLKSRYPKMEFAYKHPQNKDWFDLTVGNVDVKDIDYQSLFSKLRLNISEISINNTLLQNFKNQNIKIEHSIMPMIYELVQKAPIELDVENTYVNNFSVIYEELTRGTEIPGVITLNRLDGHIKGLTNIVSKPNQFIDLTASGYFMDTAYFTAQWKMPVDPLLDKFILTAHVRDMELNELNRLITPMAGASIDNGAMKDVKFEINATSKDANIDMSFLYNNLKISKLKGNTKNAEHDKFISFLANLIIKSDNPRKKGSNPEIVQAHIIRDPYHSTFNYFWQALQPALVESVGISKGKQNFGAKAMNVFNSIKNFFKESKKE
ncbi:hypothetical protein D0T53_07685 [Dysgonomonas sp. 216]|uniref:hypothetical protein n=1 Tax=Dysgonomonas sp. 216 TaxID=2302934 RepID=UPI0013D06305|nr:hypothetical protein [Dysgonomonas sp. 216]NDW18793.1 hypothetical protein [Dysgonomonas sp. 216]